MDPLRSCSRRRLLGSGAALGLLGASPALAALDLTPAQSEGPFYPLELPLDHDNDLVQVAGQGERASGTILHLAGRVLDPEGRPVPGARLEIWQCDAFGRYHHPGDRGAAEPQFQGFGRTLADAAGAYRFRTIAPVAYSGRTPHIHFKIGGPGFEPLTTQMYVEGHPLNERDWLFRRLGGRAALASARLEPAPDLEPDAKSGARQARFDIVLGPDGIPPDPG